MHPYKLVVAVLLGVLLGLSQVRAQGGSSPASGNVELKKGSNLTLQVDKKGLEFDLKPGSGYLGSSNPTKFDIEVGGCKMEVAGYQGPTNLVYEAAVGGKIETVGDPEKLVVNPGSVKLSNAGGNSNPLVCQPKFENVTGSGGSSAFKIEVKVGDGAPSDFVLTAKGAKEYEPSGDAESAISTGALIGIIAAAVVVLVAAIGILAFVFFKCFPRRNGMTKSLLEESDIEEPADDAKSNLKTAIDGKSKEGKSAMNPPGGKPEDAANPAGPPNAPTGPPNVNPEQAKKDPKGKKGAGKKKSGKK